MRLLVLLHYFNVVSADWNDMNEKIWLGLMYLLNGVNPYGQEYRMEVLELVEPNPNVEGWFQYPPFALIMHIPVLLWPGPPRIGVMDFMPGFFIYHYIIDFYLFYRMFKAGYHWSATAMWLFAGALFVALDFITFMTPVLLFLTLAFLNIDKPKKAALYIGLGTTLYTYLGVIALFFLVYHFRKSKFNGLKNFIIGLIPAIIVVLPFLIWDPKTFVYDIILSQSARNTAGNFLFPKYGKQWWWLHLFSITPYINSLYNLIVDPTRPMYINNLTTVLTGLAILYIFYQLYKFYKKPYRGKFLYYCFFSLLAIILVSAAGFFYYLLIPIFILVFLFDLRKEINVEEYIGDYIPPSKKYKLKQLNQL